MGALKNWFRLVKEDYKARRRGERRVVPRPIMRGRVYERPGEPSGNVAARSRPKATITARIKRAGTDHWEPLELKPKGEE